MSLPGYVPGLPGVRASKTATHRIVFRQGDWDSSLSLGKIIDGSESRDPTNTGDLDVLRPGTLMGMITASGLYAPSFVGAITGAYTSGGTTLTVSAAAAVELDRLVGQAGTAELVAVGPPSAAGTVAVTSITHSAIDTSTGAITVSSLGVNKIAGTLIGVNDGRYTPLTLIPDGYGVKVTDTDGTSIDVQFARFPIAGVITASQILPTWPSDTSLQAWIRDAMSTYGKFVFDYGYST